MQQICSRWALSDRLSIRLSTAGLTSAYIDSFQGPDTEAYPHVAAFDAVISNAMLDSLNPKSTLYGAVFRLSGKLEALLDAPLSAQEPVCDRYHGHRYIRSWNK